MPYQLMDVVSEWIAQKGKPENQRSRLYAIAVAGLRELHMDINGVIKIVSLSINDNDTVDLPIDFIRYTRIGIVGGDGRIISLNEDNSLSLLPLVDSCGNRVARNPDSGTVDFPFNGYFYGLDLSNGGQFGLGGGQSAIGYYRYDRAANQLLLANMNQYLSREIVMEYIADLSSADSGDFFVSPFIIDALKMYISWQYVYDDRNTSAGEKMMKRNEYFNSRRLANNRYSSSTPSEWLSGLRESNMAAVRW